MAVAKEKKIPSKINLGLEWSLCQKCGSRFKRNVFWFLGAYCHDCYKEDVKTCNCGDKFRPTEEEKIINRDYINNIVCNNCLPTYERCDCCEKLFPKGYINDRNVCSYCHEHERRISKWGVDTGNLINAKGLYPEEPFHSEKQALKALVLFRKCGFKAYLVETGEGLLYLAGETRVPPKRKPVPPQMADLLKHLIETEFSID